MKPNAAQDWRALQIARLPLNMIRHADKAFRRFFARRLEHSWPDLEIERLCLIQWRNRAIRREKLAKEGPLRQPWDAPSLNGWRLYL
jgi:hypothetical protein